MKGTIAFEKLKAVTGCPAFKEFAAKRLVIKHFSAEPKQTEVVCAKTKRFVSR